MRFIVNALLLTCAAAAIETPVVAQEVARTTQLPPALAALGTSLTQLLTVNEAQQVRGQALDPGAILAAAREIESRSVVRELGGGIQFFSNVFFGEGVLINLNTGTGALFDPAVPGQWLLTFSDLQGDFVVNREGNTLRFSGGTP